MSIASPCITHTHHIIYSVHWEGNKRVTLTSFVKYHKTAHTVKCPQKLGGWDISRVLQSRCYCTYLLRNACEIMVLIIDILLVQLKFTKCYKFKLTFRIGTTERFTTASMLFHFFGVCVSPYHEGRRLLRTSTTISHSQQLSFSLSAVYPQIYVSPYRFIGPKNLWLAITFGFFLFKTRPINRVSHSLAHSNQ